MPNLKLPGCFLYDIKGHTDNRFVPSRDSKDFCFGKDENFLKSQHIKSLKDSSEELKKQFITIIEKNTIFLRKKGIIDYSLILVFRNEKSKQQTCLHWHELGNGQQFAFYIIDYLQMYT